MNRPEVGLKTFKMLILTNFIQICEISHISNDMVNIFVPHDCTKAMGTEVVLGISSGNSEHLRSLVASQQCPTLAPEVHGDWYLY